MTRKEQMFILRAITKMSSAILNIDKINEEGNLKFCGKMRRDIVKFTEFFCHHTYETTTEMYKSNKSAWNELVYYWFDGIDEYVEADTFEKKNISLFLCKCRSAINDLRALDKNMTNKIFAGPLITRFDELLRKGYLKRFDITPQSLDRLEAEVTEVGLQVVKS